MNANHTDARRLTAHASIAAHCVNTECGVLPPRMRLIPLTVSIHGSFGPEATRFLSDLGKRSGGGVPVSLLDSASWACPRFAPFIRMAVSHAVRRGLAEAVLRRWRRVRDPADVPSQRAGRHACGRPPAPAPVPVRAHPPPGWNGRAARRAAWGGAAWVVPG